MRETVKNGLKLADASASLASSLPAFTGTDPTKFSDSAEIVTILNNFQRDLGAWIDSVSPLVPALAELKETRDRLPASSSVVPGGGPPRPGLMGAGKLWREPEWFRTPKAYAVETPLEDRVEYPNQSIGYDDALSAIFAQKGHLTEAQKVKDCYAEIERRVARAAASGRSRLDAFTDPQLDIEGLKRECDRLYAVGAAKTSESAGGTVAGTSVGYLVGGAAGIYLGIKAAAAGTALAVGGSVAVPVLIIAPVTSLAVGMLWD